MILNKKNKFKRNNKNKIKNLKVKKQRLKINKILKNYVQKLKNIRN